jgi:hypothetical protein
LNVIQGEGCLGKIGYLFDLGELEAVDVLRSANQMNGFGGLAQSSHDLLVAGMPNEHDAISLGCQPAGLAVHFHHKGAGGIDGAESPLSSLFPNGRGNPVGRV